MKLSLLEVKELPDKVKLLYSIAKADNKHPYYKTYNIKRAINELEIYDRYFAIVDENNVYYGGFICNKNEPHINVNKKVRGKWGHLVKKFIKLLFKDYKEIKVFRQKKNRDLDSLYKHLEKRYGMKKIKDTKQFEFYTIERIE
tara:strand:- start:311 stop:739 length:429 start_codon:yes stop_codon:yes gene_type:complete